MWDGASLTKNARAFNSTEDGTRRNAAACGPVAKEADVRWVALANGVPIPPNPVVGALYSGKVWAGHCNVGLAGRELTLRPYEILVAQ